MYKFKKILAVALAATMVIGSSVTAFADPVTSGGTDGAGTSEGHVDKKVINVVLPTVPENTTPFAYTMDPERLIQGTTAAKYAEGTTFPAAGSDTGVYFLTAENTYANTSNTLQAINKSSCDITLTVKVKTTAAASDITLAQSATPSTDAAELYLGLIVGDTTTVVKADEQTVTKVLAGAPNNFEVAVKDGAYAYQAKADATTWKAMNISMTGAVSAHAISDTTTAPTVNVTWSYAEAAEADGAAATDAVDYSDAPANAAPSVTSTTGTMALGVDTEIAINLGTGTLAATGVESVTYTAGGNSYSFAENEISVSDGKLILSHSKSDVWLNANVASREVTITFNDSAATTANVTLNKATE